MWCIENQGTWPVFSLEGFRIQKLATFLCSTMLSKNTERHVLDPLLSSGGSYLFAAWPRHHSRSSSGTQIVDKLCSGFSRILWTKLCVSVHHLTHLVTCVENLGPLWAVSAFGYESLNGAIKKPIHGTGNACHQILWGLWSVKSVLTQVESLKSQSAKGFIRDMFDTGKASSGLKAFQCRVVDRKEVKTAFSDNRQQILSEANLQTATDAYFSVAKVIRGGWCLHSKHATKSKKGNSYTAALQMPNQNWIGLEVEQFIQHKQTEKVYATGRQVLRVPHPGDSVLTGRCPHIEPVTFGDLAVVAVEKLSELFFVIETSQVYVSRFPNHIESD